MKPIAIDFSHVWSLVLIAVAAAVSFMATRYWSGKTATRVAADVVANAAAELAKRVADLESQVSLVKQAVVPISTAFQAILIKELTHFHTPEMDELMRKVGPPSTLTAAEEERLIILLQEREADMHHLIDEAERDAARILPAVMRRAKAEAALGAPTATAFKLVTVALVAEEQQST